MNAAAARSYMPTFEDGMKLIYSKIKEAATNGQSGTGISYSYAYIGPIENFIRKEKKDIIKTLIDFGYSVEDDEISTLKIKW